MDLEDGHIHPCVPVVEEVWPYIRDTCYKFKLDVRITERSCRYAVCSQIAGIPAAMVGSQRD